MHIRSHPKFGIYYYISSPINNNIIQTSVAIVTQKFPKRHSVSCEITGSANVFYNNTDQLIAD